MQDSGFKILGHTKGDAAGQQTWEALAIWCALWLWKDYWKQKRVYLSVRADSVSGLTLVMKLKAKGTGPRIIARELALLMGTSAYKPRVLAHTPGVCNVVADKLSIPELAESNLVALPVRNKAFYGALEVDPNP